MGQIDDILARVLATVPAAPVKRERHTPFKMATSLAVVCAIGRRRSPRFRLDADNRFAYENLVRWVHGDPTMMCNDPETGKVIHGDPCKGIYIAGPTGTGKSLALEVMSAYCQIDRPIVELGGKSVRLTWKSIRADLICDTYAAEGNLRRFKDFPILCVQDVGSEPTEAMYMGNRVNPLREVLESRGDRADSLTLMTSNLPFTGQAFRERYGERAVSRLRGMCNYLVMGGHDRRR